MHWRRIVRRQMSSSVRCRFAVNALRQNSPLIASMSRETVPMRSGWAQRFEQKRSRTTAATGRGAKTPGKRAQEDRSSIAANKPHEAPLHPYTVRAVKARLICRVRRFERDGIAAATQALESGLRLVHEGNDDIAGARRVTLLNDDGIAVENARVDHGVARDLQGVMFAAAAQNAARYRHLRDFVLKCVDWRAGRDAPKNGHGHRIVAVARTPRAARAARVGNGT